MMFYTTFRCYKVLEAGTQVILQNMKFLLHKRMQHAPLHVLAVIVLECLEHLGHS